MLDDGAVHPTQVVEDEISKILYKTTSIKKEKKRKKNKILDFVKLEYYINFFSYTNFRLAVPHWRLI